jgi:molybdopterin biosynthesis enzyme
MDWYGADLRPIVWVREDSSAIAAALEAAMPHSDLILTAGSHMMDPLDAILCALQEIDAPLVRLGAPAHPGSMVWLARHAASGTPILSLASCSMFSRSTVADLLMPYLFAEIDVTNDHIARLGHGGLLDRGMDWRFPPYEGST